MAMVPVHMPLPWDPDTTSSIVKRRRSRPFVFKELALHNGLGMRKLDRHISRLPVAAGALGRAVPN